jgi:hypothetical protein
VAVAFGAHATYSSIHGFDSERCSGIKDPDTLLLVHATLARRGPEDDAVFGAFKFQGITGADLQGVAYGFGEDDAAGGGRPCRWLE